MRWWWPAEQGVIPKSKDIFGCGNIPGGFTFKVLGPSQRGSSPEPALFPQCHYELNIPTFDEFFLLLFYSYISLNHLSQAWN